MSAITSTTTNTELIYGDIVLKRICRTFSNQLNKVPITNSERMNKFFYEQNLREKLDEVNFKAFYTGRGALITLYEHDKVWLVPAEHVLEARVLYDTEVVMVKCALKKIKGVNSNTWKQEIVKYTKEENGVRIHRFIEDNDNKLVKDIYSNLIPIKHIPVLLTSGLINTERIIELVGLLLEASDLLFKRLMQEMQLSGAKFLIKGQAVENTHGSTNASEKIAKALLSGDATIIQNTAMDNDVNSVDNISVVTNSLEFRSSVDWVTNKCIELSGVAELNGGDKGTANLQTTEVMVNMISKIENLEKWAEVRKYEWERFFRGFCEMTNQRIPQFDLNIMTMDKIVELYNNDNENSKGNSNQRTSNKESEEV